MQRPGPVEFIQSQKQNEKNNEGSLGDTIKWTNICMIGVPEEEKRIEQKTYLKITTVPSYP